MNYSVQLQSKPQSNNKSIIELVTAMDREQFPGCEVGRLNESYIWVVYHRRYNEFYGGINTIPVGYGSMRYIEHERFGYFSRAAIKANHRRKGLHKRLIRVRVNLAKRLGWKGVLTYAAMDNVASVNSLVKLGFQLYIPEYRWAGKDFLYLIRRF